MLKSVEFMKQKILQALKTKFVGVSEDVLERIAKNLAKTVEDEDGIDDAVDGVNFQTVLQSYGDFRADEAQKSAVSNYEKKHGLKEGKPVKGEEPDPGEVPEWFKSYKEANDKRITELTKANEDLKAEKANADRKAAITSKAKELGISDVFLKRFRIGDDEDIDQVLTEYKQDLVNSRLMPKGSTHEAQADRDKAAKASAEAWAKTLPDK